MSQRRNNLLRNENFFTLSAHLTLGETCFGTGGILLRQNIYISMCAFCITNITTFIAAFIILIIIYMGDFCSFLLSYECLITYRAVLTLSETCFGTGCAYRLINNLGVAKRIHNSLRHKNIVTYRTVLSLCKTAFGTGSTNRRIGCLGMAERRVKLYITYSTVLRIYTICCRTGGMTRCVYNCLRKSNLVTYRAVLTLGKSAFGAGCTNCRINNHAVTKCIHNSLRKDNLFTI